MVLYKQNQFIFHLTQVCVCFYVGVSMFSCSFTLVGKHPPVFFLFTIFIHLYIALLVFECACVFVCVGEDVCAYVYMCSKYSWSLNTGNRP